MTFKQIEQNEASEFVCDSKGKPLQWHEVWRPASHILPKDTSPNTMYLCLVHPREEGTPYRGATMAHFDGVCFYTRTKPFLDVDYWLPFPKYLDEAFLNNNGDFSNGRLNLQFPPEVLLYSIADTYRLLKIENNNLLKTVRKYIYENEQLQKELSIAQSIIQNQELND